jgi:hypothetical protein
MSPREPRDRDDRPSWSEIDKNRNRSSHTREDRSEGGSMRDQAWVKEAALKQAEAVFKGKSEPKQEKASRKMFESEGTAKLPEHIDAFIKEFGFPEDWRTLMLVLDHPDAEVFKKAALAMLEKFKDRPNPEKQAFKTKISLLSMAGATTKIQSLADAVLKRLED